MAACNASSDWHLLYRWRSRETPAAAESARITSCARFHGTGTDWEHRIGTTGAIYLADSGRSLWHAGGLAVCINGLEEDHAPNVLTLTLLVIYPLLSSLFWILNGSVAFFEMKVLTLISGRFFLYLVVYQGFHMLMSSSDSSRRVFLLQLLMFGLLCTAGLAQHTLGFDLDLWTSIDLQETPLNESYGVGFMGLYRGAVGAWGALVLGVATAMLVHRMRSAVILSALCVVVFASMFLAGSRQGVIIGLCALCFGLWNSLQHKRRAVHITAAVVLLAILGLSVVRMHSILKDNTTVEEWFAKRFEPLLQPESAFQAYVDRDLDKQLRILESAKTLFRNDPLLLLLGRPYAADPEEAGQTGFIAVDSEVLNLFQQYGILYLILYALFVFRLWQAMNPASRASWQGAQLAVAGRTLLVTGLLLSVGHFLLLHAGPATAPVAYWAWSLLGVVTSACGRGETFLPKRRKCVRSCDVEATVSQ